MCGPSRVGPIMYGHKRGGTIYLTNLKTSIICTDHFDEEKEKEHDGNWSFIALVTQRETGSL